MSPTFRALHNHNYRLYATGGVVSNTGTWMQRVAQDWLVVLLAANDGTALGITTGLQFLPALLLSPYAGLIADRFPKQRLLQVTQTVMALTAFLLGGLAVTGTVEVWHVYVLAFVFGVGSAFDAPARQSFVSEMVGPEDLTQRRRPQLRVVQRRPRRRPGARRPADRRSSAAASTATGWVILLNGLSYAAVAAARCARWSWPTSTSRRAWQRHKGMIRDGVRYLRGRPDLMMVLSVVFFAGHLRPELPDDLRPDGDPGLPQGRDRVRPARLGDGRRLAHRRADGGPAHAHPAAARGRRCAAVRGRRDRGRAWCRRTPPTWRSCPFLGFTALTMITAANTTMQLATAPGLRGRVMALYLMVFMGGTPLARRSSAGSASSSVPAGR